MIKITLTNGMEILADTPREGAEFLALLGLISDTPNQPEAPVIPLPETIPFFTQDELLANPNLLRGAIPVGVWFNPEVDGFVAYYAKLAKDGAIRFFPDDGFVKFQRETIAECWGKPRTEEEVSEAKAHIAECLSHRIFWVIC